tara:strand:- start:188 stop:721 length:534 start_codon:yes stop_codon:yes gene_type:complete
MDIILNKDLEITDYAIKQMKKYPDIFIYGEIESKNLIRAGTIAFNIIDMDHGIVAAILNDYFNIAVRNECFCAHPYVEKMLHMTHKEEISKLDCLDNHLNWTVESWMGMVRASIGLYTTKSDIDKLIDALAQIVNNKDAFITKYAMNKNGDYQHKDFTFSSKDFFSLTNTIDKDIIS